MKRAGILINPYGTTESELYQPRRITEELGLLGVHAEIVPNAWKAHIGRDKIETPCFDGFDFCVLLDKDKYVPRMLEKRGMRLFNSAAAVELCDDKMLTHIALAGVVPMPKTYPAPLCYKDEVSDEPVPLPLDFPVVVKECFGSLGKQVYLARDRAELKALSKTLRRRPYLLQEYIGESAGKDVRAICVGGEIVACMKRTAEGDFRSNLALGGRGEPYPADEEMKSLCAKVSSCLGLDYCGVDLLLGKDGYLVCEVNSNAFFSGIERVTGVNVAHAYAVYMVRTVEEKI